jgi:acyl-CoA thioesterase-2
VRARSALPDSLPIQQAVLAYASDLSLLQAALVPHGRSVFDPDLQVASLDHALWFHRAFRADEWLLYIQESRPRAGRAVSVAASCLPATACWSLRRRKRV